MYRAEDPHPDRICIVCYETLGLGESACGRCGAPLVRLDTPEVIDELRKRSRTKKARPARLRYLFAVGGSTVLSLVAFIALIALNVYRLPAEMSWNTYDNAFFDFWPFWILWVVFAGLLIKVSDRVFRSPPGAEAFNPDTATVPELLVWLGLIN